MTCSCLDEINKKLAETGHYLNATILAEAFGDVDRPIITIMRLNTWRAETRHGKKGSFLPSYCPFCGTKYPEPAAGLV